MICWRIVILLFSILSIVSCKNPYKNEGSEWNEDWVATMNLDGSEINYLCKGSLPCFFVADLENPEQEKLLISGINSVGIMNIDGTDKHTIIPNIGNVVEISHDRTKMLMEYSGDIYLANVDGSDIMNLTDTEDIRENYPSFSVTGDSIVYSYYKDINDSATIRGINIYDVDQSNNENIYQETVFGHYYSLKNPCFVANNIFYYKSINELQDSLTGLYKLNLNSLKEEFISQGFMYDIKFNAAYNNLIFEQEYLKMYDFSTNDSKVIYNEKKGHGLSFCISTNYKYLSVGSSRDISIMYDFETDTYVELPVEINNPSFNQETTKIVCNVIRHYPDDFKE